MLSVQPEQPGLSQDSSYLPHTLQLPSELLLLQLCTFRLLSEQLRKRLRMRRQLHSDFALCCQRKHWNHQEQSLWLRGNP